MFGTANKRNVIFLPNHLILFMKKRVPMKPPIYEIDESQDNCSLDNLPTGLFSVSSTSNAGENHPISPPCATIIKLASEWVKNF